MDLTAKTLISLGILRCPHEAMDSTAKTLIILGGCLGHSLLSAWSYGSDSEDADQSGHPWAFFTLRMKLWIRQGRLINLGIRILRCPHEAMDLTAKTLISLVRCPDWSELSAQTDQSLHCRIHSEECPESTQTDQGLHCRIHSFMRTAKNADAQTDQSLRCRIGSIASCGQRRLGCPDWSVFAVGSIASCGQRRLRSVFSYQHEAVALGYPTERTANTDHCGWMPRLIWVLSGCTRHFVGFVMWRLN